MKQPFAKTWWVKPDIFLAGCFPGSHQPSGTEANLKLLASIGIRTFISLQEEDERNQAGVTFPNYEPILRALGEQLETSFTFQRFPIRDISVPTNAIATAAVAAIEVSISAGRPVYLHCWGGHGRTATIVGLWLVKNGMSGDAALEMIRQLRSPYPELCNEPAPQTEAQKDFVRHWASI